MRIPLLFLNVLLILWFFSAMASAEETVEDLLSSGEKLLRTTRDAEGKALLQKAVERTQRAVEKDPKDAHSHYLQAKAYFLLEQDGPAMAAVDRALQADPKHGNAHFLKAKLFAYGKETAQAERELNTAVALVPDATLYWYWLGMVREELSKEEEAVQAYLKAVACDPKNAPACYKLGVHSNKKGKKEEAARYFEQAAAADPKMRNAHFNAGVVRQNLGDQQAALKHYLATLALKSDDLELQVNLVQAYHALGEGKKAEEHRTSLYRLREKQPADEREESFVRERFSVGDRKVACAEYFELKGDRAVRYVFQIFGADGKKLFRVSLGSYEITNAVAREHGLGKPGERSYHLDGYYPDDSHQTFEFFRGEPTYETVRKMVVEILEGKRHAQSETRPGR